MKKKSFKYLILLSLTLFLSDAYGQQNGIERKDGFSVGFHLHEYGQQFGYGVHIFTPQLFNSSVMVKLSGSMNLLEYIPENSSEVTTDIFQSYQVGIVGLGKQIARRIFLYGEGGLLMVLPNDQFSTSKNELGGYGLFGFEFLLENLGTNSFFIELGGNGLGSKAEKSFNKMPYFNGFMISTGFRWFL